MPVFYSVLARLPRREETCWVTHITLFAYEYRHFKRIRCACIRGQNVCTTNSSTHKKQNKKIRFPHRLLKACVNHIPRTLHWFCLEWPLADGKLFGQIHRLRDWTECPKPSIINSQYQYDTALHILPACKSSFGPGCRYSEVYLDYAKNDNKAPTCIPRQYNFASLAHAVR